MQPGRPIHSNYNVVDYSTLPQAEDTSYLYQTANSDPNYGIITDTHNTSDAFGYPEISSINVEHQPVGPPFCFNIMVSLSHLIYLTG